MITVDSEKCVACGVCGQVCPRHVPETLEGPSGKVTTVSQALAAICMRCGHCEAACPQEAIHVQDFDGMTFSPVEKLDLREDQLITLMKQRRTIRRDQEKPVPREALKRILAAARLAPTATGQPTTGVIMIDSPDKLCTFSQMAYELYEGLDKALNNPIGRFIIKRRGGTRPSPCSRISSFAYY